MKKITLGTDLPSFCAKNDHPFLVLGHYGSKSYFYSAATDSIVALRLRDRRSASTLFRLAPLQWFAKHYSTTDKRCAHGVRWVEVVNDLMQRCYEVGEYKGISDFSKALPPLISREIAA